MLVAHTAVPANQELPEFTGLSAWVMDLMTAMGEIGVGVLTFVETVFPPIPSEVILPLAGYLAERQVMSVWGVLIAATLGSLLGAWLLYGAGRRMGADRAAAMLARLPLVETRDVTRATDWFDRHGPYAVFFGRLVPGVRSLISIPAGTSGMPLLRFTLLTAAGSALWNGLLVGAGYALGTQWHVVERYADWLDAILITVLGAAIAFFVVRRLRRRYAQRRQSGQRRQSDQRSELAQPADASREANAAASGPAT